MEFPSLASYTNARKLGQDASESNAFAEHYTPYFVVKPMYIYVRFFDMWFRGSDADAPRPLNGRLCEHD